MAKKKAKKKVVKKPSKKAPKKKEEEEKVVGGEEEEEDQPNVDKISYTDSDLHEDSKKEIFADNAIVKVRFREQKSKASKNGNLMLETVVDILNPDDESKVVRVNDVRSVRAWVGLALTNPDPAYGKKGTPKKWPKQPGQGHSFIAAVYQDVPEVQPPSWDRDDGTLHYCDDVYDTEQLEEDPKLYDRLCADAKRASGKLQADLYNDDESLVGKIVIGKISSKDASFVTVGNFKAELWEEEEFTSLEDLVVFSGGLEGFEEEDEDEDDDLFEADDDDNDDDDDDDE